MKFGGATPADSKDSTQDVAPSVFAEQGRHDPVMVSVYMPSGQTWFTVSASMLIELAPASVPPVHVYENVRFAEATAGVKVHCTKVQYGAVATGPLLGERQISTPLKLTTTGPVEGP